MNSKALETTPGRRAIERTLDIKVPPAAVWKALTDAEAITHWFSTKALVTPGVGGSIAQIWENNPYDLYPITEWEPNRRLRFIWCPVETPVADHKGEDWLLEDLGGQATRVHFVNFGFSTEPQADSEYESISGGWDYFFWVLQVYLEKHCGSPRTEIRLLGPSPLPREEAWRRLVAGTDFFSEPVQNLSPGETFSLRAGAENIRGTIRKVDQKKFVVQGLLEGLNDAILSFRPSGDGKKAFCSIFTYRVDPARLKQIEQALRSQMEQKLNVKVEAQ